MICAVRMKLQHLTFKTEDRKIVTDTKCLHLEHRLQKGGMTRNIPHKQVQSHTPQASPEFCCCDSVEIHLGL